MFLQGHQIYFFDVPTRIAVARNARRHGKSRVANVAIFTARKKLQPPTRDEGFDQIFRVSPGARSTPNQFVIAPWPNS